jgi:hypothetical protein
MRRKSTTVLTGALLSLAILTGCSSASTVHLRNAPVRLSPARHPASIVLRCGAHPLGLNFTPLDRALLPVAPAHAVLAPMDVTAALVCHYAGMNSPRPQGSFLGTTVVKDPKRLARLLNDLTRWPLPKGGSGMSCPAADGTYEQLLFSSPSSGLVKVNVPRNGCAFVVSSMTLGAWIKSGAFWDAMVALDVGYPSPF